MPLNGTSGGTFDVEKWLELLGQVRACIDGLNTMGIKISGSIDLPELLKLFGF